MWDSPNVTRRLEEQIRTSSKEHDTNEGNSLFYTILLIGAAIYLAYVFLLFLVITLFSK